MNVIRDSKSRAVLATVAAATIVGTSATPAEATPRTFVVTLVGGAQVTVTVDVPPGTPVDAVSLPGVTLPVASVQEVTAPTATPGVGIQLTPAPAGTSAPAPAEPTAIPEGAPGFVATPAGSGGSGGAPQATQRRDPAGGPVALAEDLVSAVEGERFKARAEDDPNYNRDGSPTVENPSFSLAIPGAAPIGVPNFFIDKFRIPPFLLPIYQAAGTQYGVRWEVLAAINEIETDYGRNLNVSTAGAVGWMQFIPSTWKAYGVDANQDGVKDPYNPVDAIFAAARYLRAAGAEQDLRRAIFAYNHADWYVDAVMLRARLIGGLPSNFVASLTGLTQGRFPVAARATYAGNAGRRSIDVFARQGSPVIAVNDGRIVSVGDSSVTLEDVFGNTYTYTGLGKVSTRYPDAKDRPVPATVRTPATDAAPTRPASAGRKTKGEGQTLTPTTLGKAAKVRLFANPPRSVRVAGPVRGDTFRAAISSAFGVHARNQDVVLRPLRPGAKVIAGTILGRIGKTSSTASHVTFQIRPAGRGAPQIDPKPILDGWKLLESTAIYRAEATNPFDDTPTVGQVLLMDKAQLQRMVLGDPRIEIYGCGTRDIQLGQIDRRVLATLEFLSLSGFKPTVTSLKCGHSYLTASGNVSHHSSGNAVDIARINGVPVLGHQGEGSITDIVVQRLGTLQGLMRPSQIISLMHYDGLDNTVAMADHADHIHVGFQPLYSTNSKQARRINAVLKPDQWITLVDRLNEIDQPRVATSPSKAALRVTRHHRAD